MPSKSTLDTQVTATDAGPTGVTLTVPVARPKRRPYGHRSLFA